MKKDEILVKELFDAKAHLGHKKNRIHPKSKKYIYMMDNGVSVIDLTKTVKLLKSAQKFVSDLAKGQKTLLVVCTKKIASLFIQNLCQKNNLPFITYKWPGGLLTNFETITKNIQKNNKMKEEKNQGEWEKYPNHDRVKLEKKQIKLEKNYGGLTKMEKPPDALFIIDIKKEKNAISEAKKKSIPIVGLTDTNVDPDLVDYPIPANDDSLSSIEYIAKKIVDAYARHK